MSTLDTTVNTVVIGAGQAGLATSRSLQRQGISHVVLERQTVGASWRGRWDSFHLNTPSAVNMLPDGKPLLPEDGFLPRDAWIATLEAYCADHALPVHTGVEVSAVRRVESGYEVRSSEGTLRADNVVICTGDQNAPRVPDLAAKLPEDIEQLHSERYRSAAKLPEGAVLVVGSAQTGTQIVEDLLEAGRTVWLCTSTVGRAPRRYRGRDITAWAQTIGMADQGPADVPEAERNARQGMISGTHGGHSISLHALGRAGAHLLGRLSDIDGDTLRIEGDLLANVAKGDEAAAKLRAALDGFIAKSGLDAPAAEHDPVDTPFDGLDGMAAVRELDMRKQNIRSVIWATGFGGDFSYLPADCLDDRGLPRHVDGDCGQGLYCVGLAWQRKRFSGLIVGAVEDAQHIATHIAAGSQTDAISTG